jgi:hypothetical protein
MAVAYNLSTNLTQVLISCSYVKEIACVLFVCVCVCVCVWFVLCVYLYVLAA